MIPPPTEELASRLFVGPALRAQPDRRLVGLVRDGYDAAFEEIVRRYGKPLGRYAAAIVGNRSEDVTQDAFSRALLALRRDGGEIELRPWLYRIVRNTALNDLRDNPPPAEALADEIASGRCPSEEVERREELAELTRRLRTLPEPQRAAIVMRELEGLGHAEIATSLGLSGGAARQAIFRARQALRDGFGLLMPMPLLKSMLDAGGSGPLEAAAGAAGAGLAAKATVATVIVAGAVGAGVALHGAHGPAEKPTTAQTAAVADLGTVDAGGRSSRRASRPQSPSEPGDAASTGGGHVVRAAHNPESVDGSGGSRASGPSGSDGHSTAGGSQEPAASHPQSSGHDGDGTGHGSSPGGGGAGKSDDGSGEQAAGGDGESSGGGGDGESSGSGGDGGSGSDGSSSGGEWQSGTDSGSSNSSGTSSPSGSFVEAWPDS